MVALVSFSMCIINGQSTFEELRYLIPKISRTFQDHRIIHVGGCFSFHFVLKAEFSSEISPRNSRICAFTVFGGFKARLYNVSATCSNARLSLWGKCFSWYPVWTSSVWTCFSCPLNRHQLGRALSVWQENRGSFSLICLQKAVLSFVS